MKAVKRLSGYIDVPEDFFNEELAEAVAEVRNATLDNVEAALAPLEMGMRQKDAIARIIADLRGGKAWYPGGDHGTGPRHP